MPKVQIAVKGSVQGIGFRWSAREKAEELGLTLEKAENMPNRGVMFVVNGKKPSLQKFIAWAKIGPRFAKVEGVDIKEL